MSVSEAARRPHPAADPLLASLLRTAAGRPQQACLSTVERDYGYGEFVGCGATVAAALRECGTRPGDRVVVLAEAYDAFLVSMLGVWLAGGVAVPLNVTLPAADLGRLVERAAPRVVLRGEDLDPSDTGHPSLTVDPLLVSSPVGETAFPGPDDLAMILFTSGTTGIPKGVCQTMDAVTGNARRVATALGLTAHDRIFINTPPYYTSGICHFLTLAAAGGSLVGEAGFFFGDALLDRLEARACTGFGGAPAHLVRVVEPLSEARRVPGLRFWVSSGDHLPVHTIAQTRHLLPDVRLFNMYGLTEVSGRLCVLPPDELERRAGSVGRPLPDMSVGARDAGGTALPPGEVGELYVAGPLVMQGYLDDPEATAAALGPRGFRTGDFGHTDADGFVWVAGRKDDIFKRGG